MAYAWTSAHAADATVWIALSEPGGAYAETAEAIRGEIERSGAPTDLSIRPWKEFAGSALPPPRLIVTVGVGALRGMIEARPRAPLLATLIPRGAYQAAAAQLSQAVPAHGAVWLDQPVFRQLALLQLALPSHPRIGVLLGPESRQLEAELQRADQVNRGVRVVTASLAAADQLPAALQRLADEADVLLALPDPLVFNGGTIQNILTAAYRRRLPLMGFSPAYVKAGTLLALYSTPRQIGVQVGESVRNVLAGRPPPAPQGPRAFTIEVNHGVARSLGLNIDGDAAIRWTELLQTKERGP